MFFRYRFCAKRRSPLGLNWPFFNQLKKKKKKKIKKCEAGLVLELNSLDLKVTFFLCWSYENNKRKEYYGKMYQLPDFSFQNRASWCHKMGGLQYNTFPHLFWKKFINCGSVKCTVITLFCDNRGAPL